MSATAHSLPPDAEVDVLSSLAQLVAAQLGRSGLPRVTLTRDEAAHALGVSLNHFDRHVISDLRVIRSGRLILVPVDELHRWAQLHAAHPLGSSR